MAKEETFTASLVCPNCRKTGKAVCGEYENPTRAGGRPDREILAFSKGFQTGGFLDGVEQVVCSDCLGLVPI